MRLLFRIALLLPCLILGVGCEKKVQKPPSPPIKVGAREVTKGDLIKTLDVSGTLHYVANTIVSARVGAQVKSIDQEDGHMVQQGEALLTFDEAKIRQAADQAAADLKKHEALLAYARSEWEKNRQLHASGAVSENVYDQKVSAFRNTEAQVEADKAALEKAQEDLKWTKVTAPVAGILSDRYVEKGDWVAVGGNLFRISDHTRVRLECYLSDIEAGKLNLSRVLADGMDALVTVDAHPGKTFKGTLTYVRAVADQRRLFHARVYIENPDTLLLQGMFARARIPVHVIPDVARVPVEGLLEEIRENQPNLVMMVDESKKAKLQRVEIGAINESYGEVREGLAPGSTVVVQGKEVLTPGQLLEATVLPEPQQRLSGLNLPRRTDTKTR